MIKRRRIRASHSFRMWKNDYNFLSFLFFSFLGLITIADILMYLCLVVAFEVSFVGVSILYITMKLVPHVHRAVSSEVLSAPT